MNLSYAHGTATRPLIGETIGDFLDHVAAGFADNEALVSTFENKRYTYAGFLAGVNGVARAMMALGVQKGDRVGIWSTNCVAWVLVQFATAKIGAILVNLNPANRTHELEFVGAIGGVEVDENRADLRGRELHEHPRHAVR